MRCEECGRVIRNAEMWYLSGGRDAPASRSMRTLCRDCRQQPASARTATVRLDIVAEAERILAEYQREHR